MPNPSASVERGSQGEFTTNKRSRGRASKKICFTEHDPSAIPVRKMIVRNECEALSDFRTCSDGFARPRLRSVRQAKRPFAGRLYISRRKQCLRWPSCFASRK